MYPFHMDLFINGKNTSKPLFISSCISPSSPLKVEHYSLAGGKEGTVLLPGFPLSLVAYTKMLSKDHRNSCMGSSRLHIVHILFVTVALGKTEERMPEYDKDSGDFCHIFLVSSTLWYDASSVKFRLYVKQFWMDLLKKNLFNNLVNPTSAFLFILFQHQPYITYTELGVYMKFLRTWSQFILTSGFQWLCLIFSRDFLTLIPHQLFRDFAPHWSKNYYYFV